MSASAKAAEALHCREVRCNAHKRKCRRGVIAFVNCSRDPGASAQATQGPATPYYCCSKIAVASFSADMEVFRHRHNLLICLVPPAVMVALLRVAEAVAELPQPVEAVAGLQQLVEAVAVSTPLAEAAMVSSRSVRAAAWSHRMAVAMAWRMKKAAVFWPLAAGMADA